MLGPLDRAFPLGLAYPRLASRQAERVQTVQWVHCDPSAPLSPHRNDSDLGRSLLSVSVGPSTTRPGRPPWPAGHFHDWPADRQSVSRPSNGSISTHRHPCLGPRHDSDLGRSLMFLSVGTHVGIPHESQSMGLMFGKRLGFRAQGTAFRVVLMIYFILPTKNDFLPN